MSSTDHSDNTAPAGDEKRNPLHEAISGTGLERALEDLENVVHDIEHQVREANQKIDEKAGRPLWQAVVVGLTLGLTFFAALIFSPLAFTFFVGGLVAVAVTELVGALRSTGARLSRIGMVAVALVPIASSYLYGPVGVLWALLSAIVVVSVVRFGVAVFDRSARASAVDDVARGIFVLAYIPFLASFAIALSTLPGGQWWVLAAVIIVIVVDTGAYVTGLTFGRHKLAPKISPGKTWEGLAGSAVLAVVAGALLGQYMIQTGWLTGAFVALALVASATLGDLVESLIKRDIGVKDISSWLPGHGGFLDRLDSVVPSMAVIFVSYQIIN
jgi:phosphatidate cytidylyltransferase